MGPDEFLHLVKQASGQNTPNTPPYVIGHIASYDPAKHRIRAMIPSFTDDGVNYVLSPWVPLGSLSVGAGFGLQIAPLGGATAQNPTHGEAVLIHVIDSRRGVAVASSLLFNDIDTAPGGADMLPGEVILKGSSGTILTIGQNGDLTISTGGTSANINVVGAKDVSITSTTTATVTAPVVDVVAPIVTIATLPGAPSRSKQLYQDGSHFVKVQP